MNSLAIETSCAYLSIAVNKGERIAFYHERVGQNHTTLALPIIERLLIEAEIQLQALDTIIYGQGPGAFTGLRIACGLAQGLAFSSTLPLIAIPTLDCLAAQSQGHVLVCTDARQKQVYSALYHVKQAIPTRLSPITLSDPSQVHLATVGTKWRGVGDGFNYETLAAHADTRLGPIDPNGQPHAKTLLQLAQTGHYPLCLAHEAGLLYIRDKVALTVDEQQARRQYANQ